MTYWDAPPGGKDVHREVWQILSAEKGNFKKKVEFTPSKKGDESLICGICGTPSGGICYFVRKKCSAIHESQQLTSHMGVLSLKLPPPPCAVLLTTKTGIWFVRYDHQTWNFDSAWTMDKVLWLFSVIVTLKNEGATNTKLPPSTPFFSRSILVGQTNPTKKMRSLGSSELTHAFW